MTSMSVGTGSTPGWVLGTRDGGDPVGMGRVVPTDRESPLLTYETQLGKSEVTFTIGC